MIKQIDIGSEFRQIEHLVEQLEAPNQRWNIDKIQGWHPAFRHSLTNYTWVHFESSQFFIIYVFVFVFFELGHQM